MNATSLLLPILIPAILGVLCLGAVRQFSRIAAPMFLLGTAANLLFAGMLFQKSMDLKVPFGGFGFALNLRNDNFSSFILISAATIAFLLSIYAARFMRGKSTEGPFFGLFLLTIAQLQGAVLSDHLITLLFFWEGMLLTLFAMIAIGRPGAYKTAVKAFVINGATDLCLMAGIGLVYIEAHKNLTISTIHLTTDGLGGLAFLFLVIGAISKAGSMPFHSWIPDAAEDAPLPFMAFMPGSMEKLIGIYFLGRISFGMFSINHEGWAGMTLMVVGAITILLAVLMALIQKDFKRLLSFHAISQVGYMVLGIGTGSVFGIVGALFHMLNNAMYKSSLFLAGGAVEQQAGSTNLKMISGLGRKMPVTAVAFALAALAISGVPPFNGFYSKELVYDAALEAGPVFYAVAVIGSLFTAASFLKLGHAAFLGKFKAPNADVKEAPLSMTVPMMIIAAACLVFGLGNALPINGLIVPALEHVRHIDHHELQHVAGVMPHNWMLVAGTVVVLAIAVLNHLWGVKRSGSGAGAVDHIHYAPIAHELYDAAEKRYFDPYVIANRFVGAFAELMFMVDRGIDFVYDRVIVKAAQLCSAGIRKAHNGSHAMYLGWSVVAAAAVIVYLLGGF